MILENKFLSRRLDLNYSSDTTLSAGCVIVYKHLVNSKLLDKREAVIALHRAGKSDSVISETLSLARSTVRKAVKCFRKRGGLTDCSRSGRPRSHCTKPLIKCTREKIRRSPKRLMRWLAKTTNVSARTMRRVVKEDLKVSSFTLKKWHCQKL